MIQRPEQRFCFPIDQVSYFGSDSIEDERNFFRVRQKRVDWQRTSEFYDRNVNSETLSNTKLFILAHLRQISLSLSGVLAFFMLLNKSKFLCNRHANDSGEPRPSSGSSLTEAGHELERNVAAVS